MLLTATLRTDDGDAVGIIVLAEKVFKSGREGWFGQAKLEIGGRRHQCQMQAVQISGKAKGGDVEGEAGAEG